MQRYENTYDSYTELMETIWQDLEPIYLQPEEVSVVKQRVLAFNTGKKAIDLRVRFEKLSESLNQLINAVEKQEIKANDKLLESEALRLQIIIGSMILSVTIAASLAFYTSRAIAHPLKIVTDTAEQVTAESNFDLQAIVNTTDEVGRLAVSLN